jgi:hypothetical protein
MFELFGWFERDHADQRIADQLQDIIVILFHTILKMIIFRHASWRRGIGHWLFGVDCGKI